MPKRVQIESNDNQQPSRSASWKTIAFTAVLSAGAALFAEMYLTSLVPTLVRNATDDTKASRQCRPPLPNLFAENPIQADQPEIKAALERVDKFVRKSFVASQIDGLAVGIVTPNGAIYEAGMGALKANETDPQKRGVIDRNSIFRIASGSKLFLALETFILREKGALQWFVVLRKTKLSAGIANCKRRDDHIDKFFPGFTYVDGGWADLESAPVAPASKPKAPITLRQLVSHMSGLSREYPRGDMKNWPHSVEGAGPSPLNGCPFPTTREVINGLPKYPLVVPIYSYPVYSNAGMAILGAAAVVANVAFENEMGVVDSPPTWQALVRRDIFDPLGLNGSFFTVTPENKAHVAVSSLNSDEVVSR
jgi:CubicO group peptidase (beta-lactamase class C family)